MKSDNIGSAQEQFDEDQDLHLNLTKEDYSKKIKLFKMHEAPHYVQFAFISDGYRICTSYTQVFKSALVWHKDTLDMYTTLLSGIFSIVLLRFAFWSLPQLSWDDDREGLFVFLIQFGNPFFHVPASFFYHLIGHSAISYAAFKWTKAIDYLVIFWSSLFLSIGLAYYSLYHQPHLMFTAIGLVTGLSIRVSFTLFDEKSNSTRVKEVGTLAFSYFIPVFYNIFCDLYYRQELSVMSSWGICAVISLAAGSLFYGKKFPERYFPNPPITGHSLMHLTVLTGEIKKKICAIPDSYANSTLLASHHLFPCKKKN